MNKTFLILIICCGLPLLLLIGGGSALGIFSGIFTDSSSQATQVAPKSYQTLEVGTKAPDFTVTNIEGEKLNLSDFSGKILVVTSGAAWCPTCIIENKNFNPVYQEFKDQGVEFMTVDIDPIDDEVALAEFQKRYAPWHNVHVSQAKKLIEDYGFWRFEITYVIDGKGIVQFKDSGITSTETLSKELGKLI